MKPVGDALKVFEDVGAVVKAGGGYAGLWCSIWCIGILPSEGVDEPVEMDEELGRVVVGDDAIELWCLAVMELAGRGDTYCYESKVFEQHVFVTSDMRNCSACDEDADC